MIVIENLRIFCFYCFTKWGPSSPTPPTSRRPSPPSEQTGLAKHRGLPREYRMIYRGPGFLGLYDWLLTHPFTPLSSQYKFDRRHTGLLIKRQRADRRGGRGWARSQIIRPQESLVLFKSFITLWACLLIFPSLLGLPVLLSTLLPTPLTSEIRDDLPSPSVYPSPSPPFLLNYSLHPLPKSAFFLFHLLSFNLFPFPAFLFPLPLHLFFSHMKHSPYFRVFPSTLLPPKLVIQDPSFPVWHSSACRNLL